MVIKNFFGFLLAITCIFSAFVVQAEDRLLNFQDVKLVMQQILDQHVDKHEISADILKNSLKVYINQFDPERTYLLESEVKPFFQLDGSKLDQIMGQYESGNYNIYVELNRVIQQAILRAQGLRKEMMSNEDSLYQKSASDLTKVDSESEESYKSFPKTVDQLKKNIEEELVLFISLERQRFGDQPVKKYIRNTLRAYERVLVDRENEYLYLDDNGNKLASDEQINLLSMHILKSLAKSLDSHTSFLNTNEAYDMKVRLEKGFHGIGVILQRKPQGIVISRMIKDGPADKSGLVMVGDQIAEINGEHVESYALEELIDKLRDQSRKDVDLVLKRVSTVDPQESEQSIEVTLVREFITVDKDRVDVEEVPFGTGIIGKVTLHSFYQGEKGVTSEKDLRKAIKELQKKGPLEGMILDLRENSGGFLNQAVKVAGLFITNGVVVVSKYSSGEERYYRDMDGKIIFDGPLIVLTSKATASAAEIVAQALQDYGVAVVVGDEQTYGKGTIQSQTVTDGGHSSHFKVTVGKYYTVSGKTPQVEGVKADIVVPSHYSHMRIGEEYLQKTLAHDVIDESFNDELVDIDPGLKPWYLRYYLPTLQKRQEGLNEYIPVLQKKSAARVAGNREFQKFLAENKGQKFSDDSKQALPDYQMSEAVNIIKDLISLQKGRYQSGVAETPSN